MMSRGRADCVSARPRCLCVHARLWACVGCVLWACVWLGLHAVCGESFVPVWPYTPCAGRVLYRGVCAAWLVGGGLREKVLPARVVCVWTGIIFSLLAANGLKWVFFAVLGEFCTGCGLACRVWGEFCTGGCMRRSGKREAGTRGDRISARPTRY